MYSFKTSGTCAREIYFDIEENRIKDVRFIGGCSGNLSGIAALLPGMEVDAVIEKFTGIDCGSKNTSCPDQLAKALRAFQEQIK